MNAVCNAINSIPSAWITLSPRFCDGLDVVRLFFSGLGTVYRTVTVQHLLPLTVPFITVKAAYNALVTMLAIFHTTAMRAERYPSIQQCERKIQYLGFLFMFKLNIKLILWFFTTLFCCSILYFGSKWNVSAQPQGYRTPLFVKCTVFQAFRCDLLDMTVRATVYRGLPYRLRCTVCYRGENISVYRTVYHR